MSDAGSLTLPDIVQRFKIDSSGLASGQSAFSSWTKGLSSNMASFSTDATKYLTVPFLAFGAASVAAGVTVQNAYNQISRQTGAQGQQLASLKQSWASVFANVPDSAAEVATNLDTIHDKLGLTGDALTTITQLVTEFGKATGTALDPNVVTNFFNRWKTAPQEMAPTLNLLAGLAQQTGVSGTQILTTAATAAPTLQAAGFSQDQSMAIIASLGQQGDNTQKVLAALTQVEGKAQKAGEDPKQVVLDFLTAIRTGGGNLAEDVAGMSGATAKPVSADQMKADQDKLNSLIAQQNTLLTSKTPLTSVQQAQLQTLSDQISAQKDLIAGGGVAPKATLTTQQAVASLVGARNLQEAQFSLGAGAKDPLTLLQQAGGSSIEDMAQKTMTFSEQMTILGHNITLALAPLGLFLLNGATAISKTLLPVLQTVMNFINGMPGPVKTALGVLAVGGAAIGPAILGVNKLIQTGQKVASAFSSAVDTVGTLAGKLKDLAVGPGFNKPILGPKLSEATGPQLGELGAGADEAEGLAAGAGEAAPEVGELGGALGALMNPVTLIIAGIALLAAGIFYAYTHFKGFRDVVDDVGRFLKSVFLDALHAVIDGFTDFGRFAVAAFGATEGVLSTLWDVAKTVWGGVSSAVATAWSAIEPILKFVAEVIADYVIFELRLLVAVVKDVWDGVTSIISAAWSVISPILHLVAAVITDLIIFDFKLMWAVISDVWDMVVQATKAAWSVIEPVLGFLWTMLRDQVIFWFQTMQAVIAAVWQAVTAVISAAWNNIVKPTLEALWTLINDTLVPVFHFLEDSVSAVFNGIGSVINAVWDNVIEPALHAMHDFVSGPLTDVWNALAGTIASVWSAIPSAFNDGLRAVGSIVGGFLSVVSSIAGAVGMSNTASVLASAANSARGWGSGPTPPSTSLTLAAAGGHALASGGLVTNQPTVLVGEGGPHNEYVIPTDPKYRGRATALFTALGRDLGMTGFATGGVIGAIGGVIGDAASAIGSAAGSVIGLIRQGVADGLSAAWPTLPTTNDLAGIPPSAMNALRSAAINFIAGNAATPGGPVPPGQPADWIAAGIALASKPGDWLAPMYDIAKHESGFNPQAINLTDINAQQGDPSRGLFQTIMTTFDAYAVPGHTDIWDPIANTAAAANYIASRYGDPWHTPGELSEARGGPYVGYASGGVINWMGAMDSGGIVPPGLFAGVNNTGRPENLRPTDLVGAGVGAIAQAIAGALPAVVRAAQQPAPPPAVEKNFSWVINNPQPEAAEGTIGSQAQKLAYLGIFD